MISINDLLDAKDTCFDKIAQNAQDKNLICVRFLTIPHSDYLQIFISNGEDYARLLCKDFNQQVDFKISWEAFKQVCMLFQDYKNLDIKIKDKQVLFFNDKCQYTTPISMLYMREHNYAFSFATAQKISMDDCHIMKEHLDFAKFAINKDNLISCDGNVVILNKLTTNFANDTFLFTNPFPKGVWFFNPAQRVIVREDKKISCNYRYATGCYPLEAIYSILNQHLDNYFECDNKEFQAAIKQCIKISDKITIFFEKNSINLMAINSKNQAVYIEMSAKFLTPPKRTKISVYDKYVGLLNIAQNRGTIKIKFNDNDANYVLMAQAPTKTVLMMGCK